MLIQIDKKARKGARENLGNFSNPSKMPCYSWSIPAQACLTGSKLAKLEGSVCHGCYALNGFYNMPVVKKALQKRFSTLENLEQWENDFLLALQGETFFRWFDSGDLQSLPMLQAINNIARKTPHVRHWLPTKEHKLVSEFLASGETLAENLTVRLSAYMVDSYKVPKLTGKVSVVLSENVFQQATETESFKKCKAPAQGGKCLDCRSCWSETETVAYLKH